MRKFIIAAVAAVVVTACDSNRVPPPSPATNEVATLLGYGGCSGDGLGGSGGSGGAPVCQAP